MEPQTTESPDAAEPAPVTAAASPNGAVPGCLIGALVLVTIVLIAVTGLFSVNLTGATEAPIVGLLAKFGFPWLLVIGAWAYLVFVSVVRERERTREQPKA